MQNQKIQLSFLFLLVSLIFLSCGESKAQTEVESNNKISMKVSEKKEKVLRHVVLFKFKDDADQAAVSKINEAFNALPAAIPEIKDFEWGINDSPEDFHQDFTHCYLVTFASEEDRDSVYTPHPKHQEFVASLKPHLEKVFVVDYWTNP
jgi:hypothetical protein